MDQPEGDPPQQHRKSVKDMASKFNQITHENKSQAGRDFKKKGNKEPKKEPKQEEPKKAPETQENSTEKVTEPLKKENSTEQAPQLQMQASIEPRDRSASSVDVGDDEDNDEYLSITDVEQLRAFIQKHKFVSRKLKFQKQELVAQNNLFKSQVFDQSQMDKRQNYLESRLVQMEASIKEEQERNRRLEEERQAERDGQITQQNENLKKVDQLKHQVSELKDQVELQQQHLSDKERELSSIQEVHAKELEDLKQGFFEQFSQIDAQVDKIRKRHQQEIKQLALHKESQLQEMQGEMERMMEEERLFLSEERKRMEGQTHESKQKALELAQQNQDAILKATQIREKFEERRNEINELKQQLDESQGRNTELQNELGQQRLKLSDRDRELGALRQELRERDEGLAVQEERATESNLATRKKLIDLERDLETSATRCKDQQQQIDNLTQQQQIELEKSGALQSELTSLRDQLLASKRELEQMQEELTQRKLEKEQLDSTIVQCNATIASLEQTNQGLQIRDKECQRQLEDQLESFNALTEIKDQLLQNQSMLNETIVGNCQTIETQKEHLDSLQKRCDAILEENLRQTSAAESAQNLGTQLAKQLKETQQSLAERDASLAESKTESIALGIEKDGLQKELIAMALQLESKKQDHHELLRKIDLIEEDMNATAARIYSTVRSINGYLKFDFTDKESPSIEECVDVLSALENDVRQYVNDQSLRNNLNQTSAGELQDTIRKLFEEKNNSQLEIQRIKQESEGLAIELKQKNSLIAKLQQTNADTLEAHQQLQQLMNDLQREKDGIALAKHQKEQQCQRLEEDIDELKQRLSDKRKDLEVQLQAYATLQDDLKSAEEKNRGIIAQLNTSLDDKNAIINDLNNKIVELETKLEQLQLHLDEKAQQYETIVSLHNDKLSQLTAEIAQLTRELSSTRAELSSLQSEHGETLNKQNDLTNQLSQVKSDLQDRVSTIAMLEDENASINDLVEGLHLEMGKLKERLKSESDKLNVKRAIVDKLNKKLQERDMIIQKQEIDYRHSLQSEQEQVQALKTELSNAQLTILNLQQEQQLLKDRIQDLTDQSKRERTTVEDRLEDLLQRISEQEQDANRLKESLKNYQRLLSEKDQTIEEKVKLYHQQQGQTAQHRSLAEQTQKKLTIMEEANEELKDEVSKLSARLVQMKEEHESLLAKKAQELATLIERRSEDLRRVEETFRSIVDEKDAKYRELQARYETEKLALTNTTRELASRDKDLHLVRYELQMQQEKNTQAASTITALQQTKTALTQQIQKTQNETAVLLDRLNRSIRDFEQRLSNESAEREKAQGALRAEQQKTRQLEEEFDQAKRVNSKYQDQLQEVQNNLAQSQQQLAAMKVQCNKIEAERDALKGNLLLLSKEKEQRDTDTTQLKGDVKKLNGDLLKKEETIQQQLQERHQLREKIVTLESQIATLQSRMDESQGGLLSEKQKLALLYEQSKQSEADSKDQLNQRDVMILGLQTQLQEQHLKLTTQAQSLQALQHICDLSETSLQGAKQRGTELEDKLAAKSKELSETQQNLAKLISQLNETKSSSELMGHVQSQKTELLDKLQSQIVALETQVTHGKQTTIQLNGQLNLLKDKNTSLEHERDALQANISSLNQLNQELNAQVENITVQLRQLEFKHRELNAQLQSDQVGHEKAISELNTQLDSITKSRANYQQRLGELDERVKQQEKKIQEYKQYVADLEYTRNKMKKDIDFLQDKIAANENIARISTPFTRGSIIKPRLSSQASSEIDMQLRSTVGIKAQQVLTDLGVQEPATQTPSNQTVYNVDENQSQVILEHLQALKVKVISRLNNYQTMINTKQRAATKSSIKEDIKELETDFLAIFESQHEGLQSTADVGVVECPTVEKRTEINKLISNLRDFLNKFQAVSSQKQKK